MRILGNLILIIVLILQFTSYSITELPDETIALTFMGLFIKSLEKNEEVAEKDSRL